MSELEQLRQEAEQLRNQIRVQQYLFMLISVVHAFVTHTCDIFCQLKAVNHSFGGHSDAL